MRDATRGGVASVLNELARSSSVAMIVQEAQVPVIPAVLGAAEILGIDPMYMANEGKFVVFVAPEPRTRWRYCAASPDVNWRRRSVKFGPIRPGWCSCKRASAANE
jgi:hypothetical protein